jgi:hypothetical protein
VCARVCVVTCRSQAETHVPVFPRDLGWTLYNLIFYVLIAAIQINIIFATIVDEFGAIRNR